MNEFTSQLQKMEEEVFMDRLAEAANGGSGEAAAAEPERKASTIVPGGGGGGGLLSKVVKLGAAKPGGEAGGGSGSGSGGQDSSVHNGSRPGSDATARMPPRHGSANSANLQELQDVVVDSGGAEQALPSVEKVAAATAPRQQEPCDTRSLAATPRPLTDARPQASLPGMVDSGSSGSAQAMPPPTAVRSEASLQPCSEATVDRGGLSAVAPSTPRSPSRPASAARKQP